MSRPRTDAEAGRGLQRDPAEPVHEGLRHSVERVDDHDGPPFDRCLYCSQTGRVGSINPFARCPARSLPSDVEQRAERADADDEQKVLA